MSNADAPVRQYRFRPAPGSCDLLLVRHGESLPAVPGQEFPTQDGHADPALDPQGHIEAKRVAERLRDEEISAIYTSGLARTRQTAAPLAAALDVDPAEEHGLREIHLGEWEGGEFRRRARARDPLIITLWETGDWSVVPGAESTEAFSSRVKAGLQRIAAAHPDQRVVAFVHGGVISMVMSLVTGGHATAFLGADNGSLSHVVLHPDRWVLRRFNDTGHLDTDLDKPVQPLT